MGGDVRGGVPRWARFAHFVRLRRYFISLALLCMCDKAQFGGGGVGGADLAMP